ncbi:transposable element tc3 transposase [Trichonephila clavata]|uniref:Transposable element tc3 transposase n=1 Tax=Trichonephila clavata TaxID=2740835 RepID=A0A8X6KSV7_TRICU|nr:transposable element tc3 transposase [Trichonephila clavata]
MMKKFEATGSLASRLRSGRPSTAAAVATIVDQTMQSMSVVAAHEECSAREVSRQTGVSYGIVWRALRIILQRYPYKLQHNQKLKPSDFDSHRDFANLVFNKMKSSTNGFPLCFGSWKRLSHSLVLLTPTIVECGPQKIRMHLLRYPCNSLK